MAGITINPPDGWQLSVGTWNTHAGTLGAGGVGNGGIYLNGTGGVAPKIVGPWLPLDNSTSNVSYTASAMFNMVLTTYNATFNFVQYQANQVTVAATQTIYTGTLSAGGREFSSSTFAVNASATWGRWEISCVAGTYLSIYNVHVQRVRTNLQANITSNQTGIASGSFTNINWNMLNAYELLIYNGSFIAPRRSGCYQFSLALSVNGTSTSLTAGSLFQTQIVSVNPFTSTTTVVSPVFNAYAPTAGALFTISWTHILTASATAMLNTNSFNPYFQIQLKHNFAGAGGVSTIAGQSSLSVALL